MKKDEGSGMKKRVLERAVFGFAAVVITAAAWFWSRQVGDVIELLRLAYG